MRRKTEAAGSCCSSVKPLSDEYHATVHLQIQVFGAALAARPMQPGQQVPAAPAANQRSSSFNHYDNGRGLWVSLYLDTPCPGSMRVQAAAAVSGPMPRGTCYAPAVLTGCLDVCRMERWLAWMAWRV